MFKIIDEPKFGMDLPIEQKQPFLDINNIRRQVSDKSRSTDKG